MTKIEEIYRWSFNSSFSNWSTCNIWTRISSIRWNDRFLEINSATCVWKVRIQCLFIYWPLWTIRWSISVLFKFVYSNKNLTRNLPQTVVTSIQRRKLIFSRSRHFLYNKIDLLKILNRNGRSSIYFDWNWWFNFAKDFRGQNLAKNIARMIIGGTGVSSLECRGGEKDVTDSSSFTSRDVRMCFRLKFCLLCFSTIVHS